MDQDRLEQIADRALLYFWDEVAAQLPEIETGDFPPEAADKLQEAAKEAIQTWFNCNK